MVNLEMRIYTATELKELGLKIMIGFNKYCSYDIFYEGDISINRERFMFGKIKGNNGQEPKYQLITQYKV